MPYRAVMFDWDGTLIDSMAIKVRQAGLVFQQQFGVAAPQVEQLYRQWTGIPRRQLFQAIAERCLTRSLAEEEYAGLSAAFSRLNVELLKRARLFPHARETLAQLRRMGMVNVISSSAAPSEVEELVRHFRLESYFRAVLGSEGAFHKGRPHLQFVLDRYGLERAAVLVVGDGMADVEWATGCGLACVVVAHSHSRQELVALQKAYPPLQLVDDLCGLLPLMAGVAGEDQGMVTSATSR